MSDTYDFVIIGGGVVGLAIAKTLKGKHCGATICVIDKETVAGYHASGRNSGVIHAGFYYSADSLKAKFTKMGNKLLTAYCEERGIKLNRCGKLVVAKDESELSSLDELMRRANQNNVELVDIDERQARDIEPRAKTFRRALWSPTTSSVDPKEVLKSLEADLRALGVEFKFNCSYLGRTADGIATSQGEIKAGKIVNCAGLYADKIAHQFGFGHAFTILPFKGLYLYSNEQTGSFRTNIYPVPDLQNPFLGVHFTLTSDGHIKIGPTAIPAFWRENYTGCGRFKADEFIAVAGWQSRLMLSAGFDFRRLAFRECQKMFRSKLVSEASKLATGVKCDQYVEWGKPGIRAQLLNKKTKKLEMDFLVEGDSRSVHVLNAVSPAFTCSLAFAEHVVNNYVDSKT